MSAQCHPVICGDGSAVCVAERLYASETMFSILPPSITACSWRRMQSPGTVVLVSVNRKRACHPNCHISRSRCSVHDHSNATHHLKEAQEAVSVILQDAGISEQRSVQIILRSPNYINMLIEGVKELDEASQWGTWTHGRGDAGDLSFKEKIIFLAREKGDRGLLPYLESINVSRSFLLHLARHLSSEKLPDLIHKVEYMKNLLFSSSSEGAPVSRRVCQMMKNLSVPVDEEIHQALAFFEKLAARRGGVNMLDLEDASFSYLVESFPHLLSRSIDFHVKPLVEYLEAIEIPSRSIRTVLLSFPPILFYDIDRDIKPRLGSLQKVGVQDKEIGKMMLKYPWVLSRSIQQNYEEILSFFSKAKVPKSNVDRAIRGRPQLLGCSTCTMALIVEHFAHLGVRNEKLGKIIASSPKLLLKRPDEFLEVVRFLQGLGLNDRMIGKVVCRCPEILAFSVENTLKRKLKDLVEFGFSDIHFLLMMRKFPELFVSDVQNTLLPRLKYLMEAGLTKSEVLSMAVKFSPLLGYSIEHVLQPKLDFLVHTMKKSVKEVVRYPRYFSYSLENTIKPRYWVLKRRNLEYTLSTMLGKKAEDFAAVHGGCP